MSGAGGGKRPSGGDSPPGPPEKKSKKEEKTTTTLIEPIRIAGVSSTVSVNAHQITLMTNSRDCNSFQVFILSKTTCRTSDVHLLCVCVLVLCRRRWTWRSSSSRIRSCASAWSRGRRWRMSYERKSRSLRRDKPLMTPRCWLSTVTGPRYIYTCGVSVICY